MEIAGTGTGVLSGYSPVTGTCAPGEAVTGATACTTDSTASPVLGEMSNQPPFISSFLSVVPD